MMLDSPPLSADLQVWQEWLKTLRQMDPADQTVTFAIERALRVIKIIEEENTPRKKCPLCEKGIVEKKGEWLDYEHRGVTNKLYQYYCYCAECGSDFAGKDELDENRKIVLMWQEETDKKIEEHRNAKL